MNRRFVPKRALGDDPVSAAASAAAAAAASAASGMQAPVSTVAHRKKHRRHHPVAAAAQAATADPATSSSAKATGTAAPTKKPARRPAHHEWRKHNGGATDPADKPGAAPADVAGEHGHLLMIGGVVIGIGLVALLLANRGDGSEHKPSPERVA